MNSEERWMRRALALAVKGEGKTHPNPMVGCLITRGNRVLGQGYHRGYGLPHAEVEALRQTGSRARGATMVVTLEPCTHWGKTPPCVDTILRAGVRRVVIAMPDPNPLVQGRGIARLKKEGVSVTVGVCREEAMELNRAFATWVRLHRPYVTLKAAASLDGKIATATGESRWITGPAARRLGHVWRGKVDAIAVGVGTILSDNPVLTPHGPGPEPLRVIFDSRLRTPFTARLFSTGRRPPSFLTTARAPASKIRRFEKMGARVYPTPAGPRGEVDLPYALKTLARQGITHLLVEGGGTLHASFLDHRLVDEVLWFLAPILIGGRDARSAVEGRGARHLRDAWRLGSVKLDRIGNDFFLHGKIQRPS